jgi:TldD protein
MLEDLEKVFQLPARFIDVNYQSSAITNITTKDGVAKDISVGETKGFGIRVLDRVWGFASSNNSKDLLDAAKRALKAAKGGQKKIPFSSQDGVCDNVATKVKIPPSSVSLEEKIDLGLRAFDSVKEEEHIVSSSFSYIDSKVKGLYANSDGASINWESTKVAFFASVFAQKNGTLQVASERLGATKGFEFLQDPEGVAKRAGEKALRLLDARDAPSGNFTVVLDPLLTGVFIHEALGHAVEADHVLQGDSILEGRIGESIASELVTIYDDSTIEGSFGFYFYDSEGTRSRRTSLIEDGRLKGYLHSRETSSALNMENTGNARSQGFDNLPIVRMSNTFLEPKEQSFEELLEDIKQGVYLLGSKGGEVDPAKGVFQFSAEEGFLIEKGELTTSLKDVALSGETLTILKEIDAVGSHFDSHIGFCGKDGQSVPVGDGGAHIRTIAAVGGAR